MIEISFSEETQTSGLSDDVEFNNTEALVVENGAEMVFKVLNCFDS